MKIPTIVEAIEFRREAYGWAKAKMARELRLSPYQYDRILARKAKLPFASACHAYRVGIPAQVLLALRNRHQVEA